MNEAQHRGMVAKTIVNRFFPDGASRPDGLLTAIFRALGEAETRGFENCLAIFERREADNDNTRDAS